jgi:hypothetical protein
MPPAALDKITAHYYTVAKLVNFLKVAASDIENGFVCRYNFKHLGVSAVMHGFKLARAVGSLASNKLAHIELFAHNMLEYLVDFLSSTTSINDKDHILNAIEALLTPETINKAAMYRNSKPKYFDMSSINGTIYFDVKVIDKLIGLLNENVS